MLVLVVKKFDHWKIECISAHRELLESYAQSLFSMHKCHDYFIEDNIPVLKPPPQPGDPVLRPLDPAVPPGGNPLFRMPEKVDFTRGQH